MRGVDEIRWQRETAKAGDYEITSYARRAPDEQVTVVGVHGLGLSGRSFLRLGARIADERTTVLLPDLPGFGSSACATKVLGVSDYAILLAAWLEETTHGDVVLVGNSFGCQVAAALAASEPEHIRALVLIGPAIDRRQRSIVAQVTRLSLDAIREPPAAVVLALREYSRCGPSRFLRTFATYRRFQIDQTMAELSMPVVLVRGQRDPFSTASWNEYLITQTSQARLETIAGAAHVAHFSHPDDVARVMRATVAPLTG